jgi:MFS family permease
MQELTSSTHTSLVGNIALIAYTIGEAIITLSAYLTLDWQKLKWVNAIFICSILPYLYFMPETPLYLYSKRQYTKLEAVLRRIATRNKRTEVQWYPSYQKFLRNQLIQEVSNEMKTSFFKQVRQLLSHRPTVIKVLITDLLGFTTYLLYYEIGYGFEVMNISLYLGVFIGAVVEAVGYIWFFSHRYCSGPPGPARPNLVRHCL